MAGWRVWEALRLRPHIDLVWAHLRGSAGHIEQLEDGRRRITLDARLHRVDRRAVLAHELVHDEKDMLFDDDTPIALVVKGEAIVRAETVRRLVPPDELEAIVMRRYLDDGSGVCIRDVMEWYDVPADVARDALRVFEQRILDRLPPAA